MKKYEGRIEEMATRIVSQVDGKELLLDAVLREMVFRDYINKDKVLDMEMWADERATNKVIVKQVLNDGITCHVCGSREWLAYPNGVFCSDCYVQDRTAIRPSVCPDCGKEVIKVTVDERVMVTCKDDDCSYIVPADGKPCFPAIKLNGLEDEYTQ